MNTSDLNKITTGTTVIVNNGRSADREELVIDTTGNKITTEVTTYWGAKTTHRYMKKTGRIVGGRGDGVARIVR